MTPTQGRDWHAPATPAEADALPLAIALRMLVAMSGPACGQADCRHCRAVRLLRERFYKQKRPAEAGRSVPGEV